MGATHRGPRPPPPPRRWSGVKGLRQNAVGRSFMAVQGCRSPSVVLPVQGKPVGRVRESP